MKVYVKETLIEELRKIKAMGWIPNARSGNAGGVGNTLEDLLGISENNLPLANAGEWELKTQRKTTNSLITLCHIEPSPRAVRFVPRVLLPYYGWKHDKAGTEYPENERSFRQTISAKQRSDRGFKIEIDYQKRKIVVSFDANSVDERHSTWLRKVEAKVGLDELTPQPYWGFSDLGNKIGTKLLNCCYVKADVTKRDRREYYKYSEIYMLSGFSIERLLDGLKQGYVFVDFDARSGHNHGTKFRTREKYIPALYDVIEQIK